MITSTSLKNPNYLARVKAAILRAVEKTNRTGKVNATESVYSIKGRLSLEIVAWRGRGFEVFHYDEDVTEIVKAALRDYHAKPAPLPLPVIEFDSGPLPLTNIRMVASCEACDLRPRMAVCA